MRIKSVVGAAFLAFAFGLGAAQAAVMNVALSGENAEFVSATSQIFSSSSPCCGGFVNGGLTTAQDNLLTTTPTAWLANGDARFIFDNNDTVSALIIKLGGVSSLVAFGATFSSFDRVPGIFGVATSLDGITYTPVGTVTDPNSIVSGGGSSLLTTAPVSALYVEYFFGTAIGSNGFPNGAGVSEVFAMAAVPEPSTWGMLLLGFGGLGLLAYRRRNHLKLGAA